MEEGTQGSMVLWQHMFQEEDSATGLQDTVDLAEALGWVSHGAKDQGKYHAVQEIVLQRNRCDVDLQEGDFVRLGKWILFHCFGELEITDDEMVDLFEAVEWQIGACPGADLQDLSPCLADQLPSHGSQTSPFQRQHEEIKTLFIKIHDHLPLPPLQNQYITVPFFRHGKRQVRSELHLPFLYLIPGLSGSAVVIVLVTPC